jgi:GT2 family glycosyltransferase
VISISIVIPCFNYGRFLAEAIESALSQTRSPDEVVVIDDGSTDCTPEVIARFAKYPAVRAIRQANQGAIATFNRGIRASQGAFFVLLSADDRLDPRFLERTVPLLAADPRAGFAYTGYRVFGARHRVRPALPFSRARLARRPYFTASALIRRAAFDSAHGFSDEMAIGYEDWDLFLGLIEHGWHGIAVPEALFHYRQHQVASRNTMTFRTWIGLLTLLYRRHRALHRAPLPAFLLVALAEQYRLTLRAAPSAVLRRLGTPPPATARPRLCLLENHSAGDGSVRHAGPRIGGVAGFAPATLVRWAMQTRYQRAAVYHARGLPALIPAAVAALANRAQLIYEAPRAEQWPKSRLQRSVARLAARRVDALVVRDAETAAHWQCAAGIQPTLRYATESPEDREVDAQRLQRLYSDLLALYRSAPIGAEDL